MLLCGCVDWCVLCLSALILSACCSAYLTEGRGTDGKGPIGMPQSPDGRLACLELESAVSCESMVAGARVVMYFRLVGRLQRARQLLELVDNRGERDRHTIRANLRGQGSSEMCLIRNGFCVTGHD